MISHHGSVTTRATVPKPRPVPQPAPSGARRTLTPAKIWLVMLGGCLALGAISLFVMPRSLAYDPWSWLVWGREIAHLQLDTRTASTAIKPLPIFINTLLAPTGSLAPYLWLLIARAATLLAIALAFRLGHRLGGLGAGVVAAIGLAVSNEFLGYLLIQGMSEPMCTAAVLAAVDNHMESRRRWALGCLIAAGLLRPEVWPFLIAYCAWLAYDKSTWRRVMSAVVAFGVPASWFVIDWFGSRQFFRSAGAATRQSQGGPLLTRQPGLATLRETWHLMSAPFLVLFLLGFGTALLAWRRNRRSSPAVWLGLGAFGWLVVDAVLAQGRFATGAPRYLLPGVALACVVAGGFFVAVIRALARSLPDSRARVAVAALASLALGGFLAPRLANTRDHLDAELRQGRAAARLKVSLVGAVALAGGRNAVVNCGQVSTQNFQVPLVSWQLRIPIADVVIIPGATGTVLQAGGGPKIPPGLSSYRVLGTAGPVGARWTVVSTCPVPPGGG
jgi:hypothetical protein